MTSGFSAANQDLQTALGQCFWIGLNGTTKDPETQRIFESFLPGGIILFQRNVESLEQVRRLNSDLQKQAEIPLLVAIDQEGGTVERLHELIGNIPPAMALAAARKRSLIERIHESHARILRYLGFNVNFTPVLDLALTNANNGLGTRCFSDDPKAVTQYAKAVIRAHQSAGLHVCGKHFPGLGDTRLDSHERLPTVTRPWKVIERQDLQPYKHLLDQLSFVMVNHALYPEKNRTLPASLSREIVHDLLLKKWNYSGLAISDDLNMGAVSNMYNLPQAAEHALRAGNHLFLICKPEGVADAYRKLLRVVERDAKLAQAIYRNSSRILSFKIQATLTEAPRYNLRKELRDLKHYSARAAELAITRLRGNSVRPIPEALTLYYARSVKYGATAQLPDQITQRAYPPGLNEQEARLLAAKSRTDWNVVVTLNRGNNPGQNVLVDQLVRMGKKIALVEGGFPDPQVPDGVDVVLASYWPAPVAVEAALLALFGKRKATGKLPLQSAASLVS